VERNYIVRLGGTSATFKELKCGMLLQKDIALDISEDPDAVDALLRAIQQRSQG
jgi:hypothetical protein